MSTTIRERLVEVAGKFHTIEVALFSTFNFNTDFFEQNVLPALFGVDPGDTRATREQAVHRGPQRRRAVAQVAGLPQRLVDHRIELDDAAQKFASLGLRVRRPRPGIG